jgi:hypothetical protein
MGVRSEYRRRYDSNAQAIQDAQAEIEDKRRADLQRHAQAVDQQQQAQRQANEPPWQGEPDDYEALRQAGMVSAPVSRSADSYSYSPPRPKPSDIRLTPEQADMARRCGIPYEVYAANLLELETKKKNGDIQL